MGLHHVQIHPNGGMFFLWWVQGWVVDRKRVACLGGRVETRGGVAAMKAFFELFDEASTRRAWQDWWGFSEPWRVYLVRP